MYISLYRPLLQASPTTPSESASTRPGRSPSLTTTTTSTWPSSLRTASSSPRWRARYGIMIICSARKYLVSQERISGQKIFPVYLKNIWLQVKHAQCFDVSLMDDGSVVLASKDYRLYIYRYIQVPPLGL